jgi:hypothetical protein
LQLPSFDSAEHASYYKQVSKGIPPTSLIHEYVAKGSPPWHDPAFPPAQFKIYYIERLISKPLAFLAIFILSAKAEVAAWAQHEPQYYGMCYYKIFVR